MTTINIDEKIIQYLNENSTNLLPRSPVDIASALGFSAEEIWQKCNFLTHKRIIREKGMGTKIESCSFFI